MNLLLHDCTYIGDPVYSKVCPCAKLVKRTCIWHFWSQPDCFVRSSLNCMNTVRDV